MIRRRSTETVLVSYRGCRLRVRESGVTVFTRDGRRLGEAGSFAAARSIVRAHRRAVA